MVILVQYKTKLYNVRQQCNKETLNKEHKL